MKNQNVFVSISEENLDVVAGGFLDILNGSLNCNTINVLSGIAVNTEIGDVLSNILNIGNEFGCGKHGASCVGC